MTGKQLNWGLLSTARINHALIPPLKRSKRAKLIAVASRVKQRAEEFAKEWDIPIAYGSYEDLLADQVIDVIYNPLPNGLHAEWTIKALQAGKHVLCEKPLAVFVAEVDAIKNAAEKSGRFVAEAFMYRHHPQTLRVKELVDSGAIGTLQLIKGAFTFNLTHKVDVRLDASLSGGSIWDIGCYPISYARYIVGAEPTEVFGWQVQGSSGVDVIFVGQMRFPGDVLAQFDCGFRAPRRTLIEIVGNEGTIRVNNPFRIGQREQIILESGKGVEKIPVRAPELYLGEVEDMADAIIHNKPPRISLEDSRGNIATILALLESSSTAKSVDIPGNHPW